MRRFMMIIETDLRSPLMMPFWRSRIGDDEPDKSNEPNKMEDPLLRDDGLSATAGESGSSSAAAKDDDVAGAGVGPGVARLEQDDQTSDSGTIRPRRRISTLAWILVPTALVFAGTFLAAAFLPAAPVPPKEEPADPPSNSSENNHTHLGQEPLAVTPTLLSVKDHETGELLSVKEEMLYGRIRDSTFHSMSDLPVYVAKQGAKILTVSNNEIRHGEALTLEWHSRPGDDGEDILALYCPAGEEDPRKFRDAATLPQAKATHAHCDIEKKDESRRGNDVWTIPSFPLVREESCEFRLYHHHTTAGGSGVDDGGEDGRSDVDLQQQQQHHYTFVASTGAISLTSSKSPTGIHLGLTGKPTEVFIQFATDDSGQPLAEIAKKSDVSPGESGRKLLRGVDWTKIKGSSTTYAAADMCQAPATSTDPGFFVNPGYLHTIRVQGLEAGVEYAYRVGLSFGQGVKWTDDYYVMRGPLPRGAGSSDPEKPALTFLSLANQGCGDSGYDVVAGADPPTATESDAQNVMNLIVSLIEGETVDAIHHLGNLAYADGAGHVWDAYANMIQSYAARVPITVGVGNHEYDHTDGGGDGKDPSGVMSMMGFHPSWGRGSFGSTGGECGVPVSKRFAVPEGGNGVFWYSYDQSLVHTVMLSSEHNMTAGSRQHIWLEKDLAAVNRSVTPWLVVEMHRPMYNSELVNWVNPMVSEGMQDEIEGLLRIFEVDLVLSGHYHSYFRSCAGLYSYRCNNGGPTYITVGTGGAPLDAEGTSLIPNDYTAFFDKGHHGVGRASVYNATSLHWEFVAVGGVVTDEVWLTREDARGRRLG